MRLAGIYKSHDLMTYMYISRSADFGGHEVGAPCTLDRFLVQLSFSSYHLAININQLSNYYLAICI